MPIAVVRGHSILTVNLRGSRKLSFDLEMFISVINRNNEVVKNGICLIKRSVLCTLEPGINVALYVYYTQSPLIRPTAKWLALEVLKNSSNLDTHHFLILQVWALAVS